MLDVKAFEKVKCQFAARFDAMQVCRSIVNQTRHNIIAPSHHLELLHKGDEASSL